MVPGIHARSYSRLCAALTGPSVRKRHVSGSGGLRGKVEHALMSGYHTQRAGHLKRKINDCSIKCSGLSCWEGHC